VKARNVRLTPDDQGGVFIRGLGQVPSRGWRGWLGWFLMVSGLAVAVSFHDLIGGWSVLIGGFLLAIGETFVRWDVTMRQIEIMFDVVSEAIPGGRLSVHAERVRPLPLCQAPDCEGTPPHPPHII
jgi:hypothetical protein